MNEHYLELLCCSECKAALTLKDEVKEQGEIVSGTLTCASCGRVFPIKDHIPVFSTSSEQEGKPCP